MLTVQQEKNLIEILEKNKKFDKVVNNDYGDTLEFLGKQWSQLAWIKGVAPEEGAELIETIVSDLRILLGKLIEKKQSKSKDVKKEEIKDGTKEGNTPAV